MEKASGYKGFRSHFTQSVLEWYEENNRPLPWKEEKDPYLIWLSEIILQQTRVEQGKPYFEKFKNAFPTIFDLAKASEDQVLKLWQGLGYYSRARNLHYTAKTIVEKHAGQFPRNYKEILALKGIGPYTAAAIASFAFDLPHAAVDGNVYRVLSRYFGESTPIDSTEGKKLFFNLANQLIDKDQPGKYNQALIDFGAIHCKPKAPKCEECILRDTCKAQLENAVEWYPLKSKKIKKRDRFFNYIILNHRNEVVISKRIKKDIWQNLYEFPMIESTHLFSEKKLLNHIDFLDIIGKRKYQFKSVSKTFKHVLTHQNIYAKFWEFSLDSSINLQNGTLLSVPKSELESYAFPKLLDWYLQDKTLYLNL